MDKIKVTNPKANQILVYDEISSTFINVDGDTSSSIDGAVNLGTNGSNIFHDINGDNLRFKTIVGGNGITLNDNNSYVEIEFDGDAKTLSGLTYDDFLKTRNNLSEVDNDIARTNLDVYSVAEANNIFMEANASNIPDIDNKYDLGSNGRRYADMYAETFHGTATSANIAWQLTRNNATEGQVLKWQNSISRWVPVDPTPVTISGAIDLDTTNLKHRSIIRYNANRNRWEPELFELGEDGASFSGLQNVGSGYGIYKNRSGFVGNLRTLRGASGIKLRYDIDEEEIIIESDAPRTTDELPEGSTNLYFTDERADFRISKASITDLDDVHDSSPIIGQGLVWDGRVFQFRNVAVDIHTSNDIPEGNANKYFTEQRVKDVIDSYVGGGNGGNGGNGGGFASDLDSLTDVIATHNDGNIIVSDGVDWRSQQNSLHNLVDVTIGSIIDGGSIRWDNSVGAFVEYKTPEFLSDLNENNNSLHFNDASFDTMLSGKNTDDISEGGINKFLTSASLIDLLNNISINQLIDVDIRSVSDEDILVWSQVDRKFVSQSPSSSSAGGGVDSLFDLVESSFDSTTIKDRDLLIWDGTNDELTTVQVYDRIASMEDVDITNLTDGDILQFDGSNFINKESLKYVINNPLVNEVLTWDGDKFINADLGQMGSISVKLSSLLDVDIDSSLMDNGDTIVWDDTSNTFVASTSARFINIVDIVGMSIDDIKANDGIRWDGNKFTKTTLPFFNPQSFTNEDILVYDTTENAFITKNKWDFYNIEKTVPMDKTVYIHNSSTSKFDVRRLDLSDIEGINDATTSTKVDNRLYHIEWNDTNSSFDIVDNDSIVDYLNQHSDVNINSIQNEELLVWNGSAFENRTLSITEMNDVNMTAPSDKHLLIWDGTEDEFVNDTISVEFLDNVEINTLVQGNILSWDATTEKFINDMVKLEDVDGMNIDPSAMDKNDILQWDNANNEFVSGKLTTESLSDVELVNIDDNHVLFWDTTESVFKNRELTLDENADVVISNLDDGDVLVWDGLGSIFANRKMTMELLGDVDLTFKSDGHALKYNAVAQTFELGGVADSIESLSDSNVVDPSIFDVLVYDPTMKLWTNTNLLKNLQTVSFEKSVFFESTGSMGDGDYVPGSLFNYDEIWSDISYHYREVTEDTTFQIKNRDDHEDVKFLYVNIKNPDNFDISFELLVPGEIDYDEGTQEPDTIIPVTYMSDVNWVGDNRVTLHTEDNETWYLYETISPFGRTLPSISIDDPVDGGVYVYDEVSEQLEHRALSFDDVTGSLNRLNYKLQDTTSANIEPSDSPYQSITPSSATDYIINDITISNSVFKFTIILDNGGNNSVTIASQTGQIEYIESSPSNYNGKFMVECITLNGSDWILDVKEIVQ